MININLYILQDIYNMRREDSIFLLKGFNGRSATYQVILLNISSNSLEWFNEEANFLYPWIT
jgi:hypothetical protein